MSTMAGIVDGTGSIGAAIIQMIIPYFKTSSFYIYFGKFLEFGILIFRFVYACSIFDDSYSSKGFTPKKRI